jgi:hypothetical protein
MLGSVSAGEYRMEKIYFEVQTEYHLKKKRKIYFEIQTEYHLKKKRKLISKFRTEYPWKKKMGTTRRKPQIEYRRQNKRKSVERGDTEKERCTSDDNDKREATATTWITNASDGVRVE